MRTTERAAPAGALEPDVRVGIVSWNTSQLLDRCLQALPAALGDLRAEVVVVDNASSDDSVAVAHRHPFAEIRRNATNIGYARGMNQALRGTTARALVALNPDTDPPPTSLARLVADLDGAPAVGLVVPRLLNEDGTLQHSIHRYPSPGLALTLGLVPRRLRRGPLGRHLWLEGFAPHDRRQELPGAWAIGAVHCIRAAALNGEDPYAERWFMYTEDMDFCWRLQQRGWRLELDADVEILHVGNAAATQAWPPLERELNIVSATYEWYRTIRGPAATRRLAAAHVAGSAAKLSVSSAGAMCGPWAHACRERTGVLAPLLGLHARWLLRAGSQPSHSKVAVTHAPPGRLTASLPNPVRRAKDRAMQRIGPELALDWFLRATRVRTTAAAWRSERTSIDAVRRQRPEFPEARIVTVIPTYQRPDLLARAVASALAQTVDDHIVIVINDGGRPPELAADDRLICVTLPANTGSCELVRNVGIGVSRSEYLAFLDDDNEWLPHHLAVCLDALRTDVQLVYSAVARVRPDGSQLDVLSWPFDRGQLRRGRSVDASSIVARRGRGVRFSRVPRPCNSPGDWELVWRLSRRHRVVHVPEVTVRYLVNPDTYYSRWARDELYQVGGA